MQLANLWIFFYNDGTPLPPVVVPPCLMVIVIDLPELTLTGAMTLGS